MLDIRPTMYWLLKTAIMLSPLLLALPAAAAEVLTSRAQAAEAGRMTGLLADMGFAVLRGG